MSDMETTKLSAEQQSTAEKLLDCKEDFVKEAAKTSASKIMKNLGDNPNLEAINNFVNEDGLLNIFSSKWEKKVISNKSEAELALTAKIEIEFSRNIIWVMTNSGLFKEGLLGLWLDDTLIKSIIDLQKAAALPLIGWLAIKSAIKDLKNTVVVAQQNKKSTTLSSSNNTNSSEQNGRNIDYESSWPIDYITSIKKHYRNKSANNCTWNCRDYLRHAETNSKKDVAPKVPNNPANYSDKFLRLPIRNRAKDIGKDIRSRISDPKWYKNKFSRNQTRLAGVKSAIDLQDEKKNYNEPYRAKRQATKIVNNMKWNTGVIIFSNREWWKWAWHGTMIFKPGIVYDPLFSNNGAAGKYPKSHALWKWPHYFRIEDYLQKVCVDWRKWWTRSYYLEAAVSGDVPWQNK